MHEIDIVWRLGLALLLSSAIGVEREMRQKSAGLRTYTLVGVGSAVFMLVSIFGFADVVGQPNVTLDPSRVAAQIVDNGDRLYRRRHHLRAAGHRAGPHHTAAGAWVTAAVGDGLRR